MQSPLDLLRAGSKANVLLIKAMGGGWTVSNLPRHNLGHRSGMVTLKNVGHAYI
jgi:hypothetical protein